MPCVGDIVEIQSPHYLKYAPMPAGVIDRIYDNGFKTYRIAFVMSEKKLWMLEEDFKLVGHADGIS